MNKLKLKVLLKLKKFDKLGELSDSEIEEILENKDISYDDKFNLIISNNYKITDKSKITSHFKDVDAITLVKMSNYLNDYTYLFKNFYDLDFKNNNLDFDELMKLDMAIMNYVNSQDRFLSHRTRLIENDSKFTDVFSSLEESKHMNMSGDLYRKTVGGLINENPDKLVGLMKKDEKFKNEFIHNLVGPIIIGSKMDISFSYFIQNRDILSYLVTQKEFVDNLTGDDLDSLLVYTDKKNMDILSNLPVSKKKDIIKLIVASVNKETKLDEFKILFKDMSYHKTEFVTKILLSNNKFNMDFIREMNSFIEDIYGDDKYFEEFTYLYENLFDEDFGKAEAFSHKYKDKPLYEELCKTDKKTLDELKDKVNFLSTTAMLENIDNIEDLKNNSLDDIKKFKIDIKNVEFSDRELNVGDDLDTHKNGKPVLKNNKGIGLIDLDGNMKIYDDERFRFHEEIIKYILDDNKFDKAKFDLKDENSVATKLSEMGYTILIYYENEILIYLSSKLCLEDKDKLLKYLESLDRDDIFIASIIQIKDENGKYNQYELHDGKYMSIADFAGELDRMDLKNRHSKVMRG